MKKFLLSMIAMAFVAISANAATYTWDKSLVKAKTSSDTTLVANGLSLVVTNNGGGTSDYVNTGSDFLHWNGTSKSTIRNAKFTAPKDGTITIEYKSNNTSATDRVVACASSVKTGTDVATLLATDGVYAAGLTNGATTQTITGTVKAGDVYIYNANGGCGILSIKYECEDDQEPTPTSSALIEYNHAAAVTSGVAISGTTVMASAKIHTNKDAVDCIQLKNGYTTNNALNENYITLSTVGGFKAGDTLSIAGFFSNSDDTKNSAADIFVKDNSDLGCKVLFTTNKFINGRLVNDDPVVQNFVLTDDIDTLYIGRNGNTSTYIYSIKVVRASATAKVKFTLTNSRNTEGVVKSVVYNIPETGEGGDVIEGLPTSTFDAEKDKYMIVILDEENYQIYAVLVNDKKVTLENSSFKTLITEDTTVEIFAIAKSATGINAVANENAVAGKFIENGKFVIIKNGKKYYANGQLIK